MNNNRFLIFFLFLLCYTVFGQHITSDNYLDSLQLVIEKATTDEIKKEALFLKGEYLVQRNPELAEQISKELTSDFIVQKDSIDIIRNTFIFAASHRWQGNYQTALKNYEFILGYSKRHSDSINIAQSSHFIGTLNMFLGNNVYAQNHLLQASRYYEKVGTPKQKARILNSLAGFYLNVNQLEKGAKQYLKALRQFEILKDTAGMANVNANLGMAYTELGEFSKAETHLLRQKELNVVFSTQREMGFHHDFMGVLKLKEGKIQEAYQEHLKALKIREQLSSTYNLCESKLNVGTVLIKLKNYPKAIAQLNNVLAFNEHQSLNQQLRAYEKLSTAYEKSGNIKEALKYFKLFKKISDSIYSKESIEIIAEKDALYNREKKESEIKLLNKEKEITEISLSKSKSILNIVLLGITLLVITSVLLYYFYIKIKSKNTIISKELKNKEFLLREIHHRVKNSLQRISSLLNLQSKYLDNPESIEAILKGKGRVQSMALIHENLYQGTDLSQVDMQHYFENLVKSIIAGYKTNRDVKHVIDVKNIKLDIEPAISVGLLVNELITNALKHAFPKKIKNPTITVDMNVENTLYKISVSDNGVGIKEEFQKKNQGGFGKRLIELLVNKMEAQISFTHTNGTKAVIEIPHSSLS